MQLRLTLRVILLSVIIATNLFGQNPSLQQISENVKIDSLMKFIKELSGVNSVQIDGQTVTIATRYKGTTGNTNAEKYLKQKFSSYGLSVIENSFSTTGKNIIGVKTGTKYPNQKYIICAHFDDMPSGTLAPGADDNGSGTAAVIEAARVLQDVSFPFTVLFCAWDEEEQGLVGSDAYATAARTANDSILGVVNMDMIAYDNNNDGKVEIHARAVANSLQIKDKMVALNSSLGIGLTLSIQDPGLTASDHASFWDQNYSAVLIIENYNGDFNAYYHTTNDQLGYFNQPYFLKCAKLSIVTLASYAYNLNISLAHTPQSFVNSEDTVKVKLAVNTGLSIGAGVSSPRLYYRFGTGGIYSSFNPILGSKIGPTDEFIFAIPGKPSGTTIQYYFAVQDSGSNILTTLPAGGSGFNPPGSTAPSEFYKYVVANGFVLLEDSASTSANWAVTGNWGTTTTKFVTPPASLTDSPAGLYGSNITSTITNQTSIDLSNCFGAILEYDLQFDLESGYDYSQIQISTNNGTTWVPLTGLYTKTGSGTYQPAEPLYNGVVSSWVHERIDLSQFLNSTLKFRFLFKSDGSITKDGIYFDNFKISKLIPVPVELLSFSGVREQMKTVLTWATGSELNCKGFEIQKSYDGINYNKIGFVQGNGTSNSINKYIYEDLTSENKRSYYRLTQIDFDGSLNLIGNVFIDETFVNGYQLSQNYPNPFNPSTTIQFSIPEKESITLSIYDIYGGLVDVIAQGIYEPGTHRVSFNAAKLSSGTYFYKINSNKFSEVKKMIYIK